MSGFLRRYTDLPFLLDYLRTKELALLSPNTWDDKNDSHYLRVYAQSKGVDSVYALCLSEAEETYHHWKIFTSAACGVCIEFDKESLLGHAKKFSDLRTGKVNYMTLDSLRSTELEVNELPFIKRRAFKDEAEFRIFMDIPDPLSGYRIPVPASVIRRVILSPWMPLAVARNVRDCIQAIQGCKSIRVFRSTLVNNESWKNLALSAIK